MDWIELLGSIAIFSYACNLPTTARNGALAINDGVGSALCQNTVERSSVRHAAGHRAAKQYRYHMRPPPGIGYLTRRGGDAELAR